MVTPISQEDRELAESFWEDCGKELLIRLSRNNITLYRPSSKSSYLANAVSSICICKCSYHNKRGKQRVKWFKNPPKNIKKRKRVFGSLNQSILNAESIPWRRKPSSFDIFWRRAGR